ncbi:MAG: 50S ribosomal protein L4 [Candidatus Micrarchaeota archaeon]|nr:50S ribosomal protein L4 [Candidatus Micrarchaeota archaeon]
MNVYDLDGKVEKSIELPEAFSSGYREDLVRRALLAEQSLEYQPQGHDVMAGLRTTAVYVGNYKSYRTGRHMGIAIRPRQKLGGGAQGDVRRIPSATKGRRAHPHKIEKTIVERINNREYVRAVFAAISGCRESEAIKERHRFKGDAPIIIDQKIEGVSKTKQLMQILEKLGVSDDLDASHKPRLANGMRRKAQLRHFRRSVLIVAKDASKISKAGRNIPGVEVCSVSELTIQKLAPGGMPRLSVWSENSLADVKASVEKMRLR